MITALSGLQPYFHELFFYAERLPSAIGALALVMIFGVLLGPLRGNANPFLWQLMNGLFGGLGAKLDNTGRTARDLTVRGAIFSIFMVIILAAVGIGLQILSFHVKIPYIFDIVALSLCLTAGSVWFALFRLYKAIVGKNIVKGAFYALAVTTRTDLSASDEYTITRAGLGMAARTFDKGMIAPLFWYLLGGLPAVLTYTAITALAWRFGKDGTTKGFGRMALVLDQILGFIPGFIAGNILALAGLLTPTAGMTRAFLSLCRPASKGAAQQAAGGFALTALAFALDVSLGGPRVDQDGAANKSDWVGPSAATAKLEAKHLHRGLYLSIIANMLILVGFLSTFLFNTF